MEKKKNNTSILLGAALLMATSAVGPGFLTQSATFTATYMNQLAIVILLLVQQIDSNIIYPKVVGSSTGLHPLAVLLSVSVFGYFGGIIGMLLAVPTAGVAAIFIRKWVSHREFIIEQKQNENTAAAEE